MNEELQSGTPEYDFSKSKPNKLATYFEENGVRVLDEDVRDAFPDSEAVNKALRGLLELANASRPSKAA